MYKRNKCCYFDNQASTHLNGFNENKKKNELIQRPLHIHPLKTNSIEMYFFEMREQQHELSGEVVPEPESACNMYQVAE